MHAVAQSRDFKELKTRLESAEQAATAAQPEAGWATKQREPEPAARPAPEVCPLVDVLERLAPVNRRLEPPLAARFC